ncbi:hypothetical protein TH54_22305, partial [Escherichia coli]
DVFAGKKSAQIREILISESAWEEMTCLFAPSLANEANIPIMERGMFIVCWDHKLNKYRNEEQTKIWNITTKN